MIAGVNLGGWLVLERWITPSLFHDSQAVDEAHLWPDLTAQGQLSRLWTHRRTFVTEQDFADLAARGIQGVRLPLPYFVLDDHGPYRACVDELDQALTWAERHRIAVLLDLHTVPDSQNGHDGGGLSGVCKWHRNPAYVDLALDVRQQLTIRYRDHPALWGIEVLNEPISAGMWHLVDVPRRYPPVDPDRAAGSEPIPTEFLRGFYDDAYAAVRRHAPRLRIVFHDGFRADELLPYFESANFAEMAVDTHLYLMHHTLTADTLTLEDYMAVITGTFQATLRTLARSVPVIVGEWSLDTATADGGPRQHYHRALAHAQLEAWQAATAQFFWTYKMEGGLPNADLWDWRRARYLGYFA